MLRRGSNLIIFSLEPTYMGQGPVSIRLYLYDGIVYLKIGNNHPLAAKAALPSLVLIFL